MPVIDDRPELNLKTVIYATDFSLSSKDAGLSAGRTTRSLNTFESDLSTFWCSASGRLRISAWR